MPPRKYLIPFASTRGGSPNIWHLLLPLIAALPELPQSPHHVFLYSALVDMSVVVATTKLLYHRSPRLSHLTPLHRLEDSQTNQTVDESQPLLSPESKNKDDDLNGENNNDINDHDVDDEILFESRIGDDEDIEDFAITEFTSDEFEVNERCRYYMDNIPISSDNRAAVEFVYMIEADTIVRSQNTLRKPELAAKLLEIYKQLISLIPPGRFGECGLQAAMCHKYFKAKKSSATGLQEKVKLVKPQVQAVCRTLNLSKLPSGRGINDVKKEYIIQKYRETMGEVRLWHACLTRIIFICNTNHPVLF